MRIPGPLLALALLVISACPAVAQVGRPTARVQAVVASDAARVGQPVRLALQVTLPARYHVQSNAPRDKTLIPTLLELTVPAGVKIDEIIYPGSTDLKQAGQAEPLLVFGSTFVIGVRATVAADAKLGPVEVKGKFRYQACDDQVCYLPLTADVSWTVRVVAANAPVVAQNAAVFADVAPSALLPPSPPPPEIVAQVRARIAASDMPGAERLVAAYRGERGVTPDGYLAMSWLGRGYLAAGNLDKAEEFARQTYDLGVEELKKRPMDQETNFPTGFGAAIEVLGNLAVARGQRSEAVAFLEAQLKAYGSTSIQKRTQKNLNLVSLEGTLAPDIDVSEVQVLGIPKIEPTRGKVVMYFFWAHWCPDCKAMSPILEEMVKKYGARGFMVVAPTQRYGYAAEGKTATPAEEKSYIAEVRRRYYPWLNTSPMPMSEKNLQRYGVSTTPTLVLVDRQGIVRLYKPGKLTEAELEAQIQKLL